MNAPFKYPGAKWSYAEWIVSFFPEHKFYLEPFFGSGAVFFNKAPAKYETINDLDNLVVNFFRACRDYPDDLARAINLTPFSRQEFNEIQEPHSGKEINLVGDIVEDARRFAIRCTQGFGSKMADRVGWKNTKQSNGPVNPAIWSRVPESIYLVAKRLKAAQIENTNAVELIKACNNPDCLIYADPPYLGETRSCRMYRKEMMDAESHKKLLDALLLHKGPVILSGYDNDLYNDYLHDWHSLCTENAEENGRFIAHARTDIPALLGEVERLNGAIQEWIDGICISQKHLSQIGQLHAENATLKKALEDVTAERDALLADLKEACACTCGFCAYNEYHPLIGSRPGANCPGNKNDCNGECKNFKWRGIQQVQEQEAQG